MVGWNCVEGGCSLLVCHGYVSILGLVAVVKVLPTIKAAQMLYQKGIILIYVIIISVFVSHGLVAMMSVHARNSRKFQEILDSIPSRVQPSVFFFSLPPFR